jgi:spermidine synthase
MSEPYDQQGGNRVVRDYLVLFLLLLSGAAGLMHEFLWTRRVVDLSGAAEGTFARVVGAFFLGLGAGAILVRRLVLSPRERIFWVAAAEFAVAALSSVILIGSGNLTRDLDPLSRDLVLTLLIFIPAAAMGTVLPLLAPLIGRERLLLAYALNTVGSVMGLILCAFLLLPRFGFEKASAITLGLSACLAAAFSLLAFTATPSRFSTIQRDDQNTGSSISVPKKWWAAAFYSGFAVIGLEILLQQQFLQIAINSSYSIAYVLGLVLLSLFVGALIARLLPQNSRSVAGACFLTACLLLLQPMSFLWISDQLQLLPYSDGFGRYLGRLGQVVCFAVLPVSIAGGTLFPLLFGNREQRLSGADYAALLGINAIGGFAAAEAMRFLILPIAGLWGSAVVLSFGYFIVALLFSNIASSRKIAAAAASLLGCVGLFVFYGMQPQVRTAPGEKVLEVAVSGDGVVSVLHGGEGDRKIVLNNSYTLGGAKARLNQERQGLLPLLLHPQPRRVALLGVATGSTLAGAAMLPEVERIDAFELSRSVLAMAEKHFGPIHQNVFADPKVKSVPADAREFFSRGSEGYDVVIGDLFLPWRTGEGRMFALDHFRNVRRRLNQGGIFCQWLPLYQLTREQFNLITRTFASEFPNPLLLRGDFYSEFPIVALVGGVELKKIDWALIENRCATLRAAEKCQDPLLRWPEGVAMMLIGQIFPPGDGPLNTLNNSLLEWSAARNVIGLQEDWFIGVPYGEYIRAVARKDRSQLPVHLQSSHESGEFFFTLDLVKKLHLPELSSFLLQVPDRMPARMWNDPRALWEEWPSIHKPRR